MKMTVEKIDAWFEKLMPMFSHPDSQDELERLRQLACKGLWFDGYKITGTTFNEDNEVTAMQLKVKPQV